MEVDYRDSLKLVAGDSEKFPIPVKRHNVCPPIMIGPNQVAAASFCHISCLR